MKRSSFPAAIEADGLAALAYAGVPTPRVMAAEGDLVVRGQVHGVRAWPGLGRASARIHRTTGERYGWHLDNRAGRFVQPPPRPPYPPPRPPPNRTLEPTPDTINHQYEKSPPSGGGGVLLRAVATWAPSVAAMPP